MQLVAAPSINETSFSCPHCGALAKQFWFYARGKSFEDDRHPTWLDEDSRSSLTDGIQDETQLTDFNKFFDRLLSRRPFLQGKAASEYTIPIHNLNFSRCYNCKEISIWLGEGMLWPNQGPVARPNTDMPQDALTDYVEAAEIVNKSPRGAAALLRLAIQKICMHLGGKGHLNNDIAKLVENGLDVRVQQSLDVVRVVGNNAVHPGELDISDNRSIADSLFGLVNLIVDVMISQPKQVEALYAGLPQGALAAIEKRDGKGLV